MAYRGGIRFGNKALGELVQLPAGASCVQVPGARGVLVIPPPATYYPNAAALQAAQNAAQAANPGGMTSGPGPGDLAVGEELQTRVNWVRPALIPDSMLPPPLQRSNPLVHRSFYRPNQWDMAIANEAAEFEWYAQHGGLRSCCRIREVGAIVYDQNPAQVMPVQGALFQERFSQPLSAISGGGAPFTGADTALGSFRVPIGYDGVLDRVVAQIEDITGFVNFSGSIVWRVKIANRFAQNLGNITNVYSSWETVVSVPGYGIPLVSGQTVTIYASIPAGSPVNGSGVVSGGLFGWFYPRR